MSELQIKLQQKTDEHNSMLYGFGQKDQNKENVKDLNNKSQS